MRTWLALPLLALAAAVLAQDKPAAPKPASPMPNETAPRVVMRPTADDLSLKLCTDVAPRTVENFTKLAKEGFYNGTAFHRIIKGFMIQGGCPNTKAGAKGAPGTGGPGYQIKAEFNDRPHVRGVISMARSAHPDSAGCQFFVCHGDARFLDRQYTAFGKLVAGDDVLEKIATIPCSGPERSSPSERVEIKSVEVLPAGK